VNHSPDPLLREQLYEIIGQDLKQKKVAQMDSDFAFEVIEPPVVPDEAYSPWVGSTRLRLGFWHFPGFWVAVWRERFQSVRHHAELPWGEHAPPLRHRPRNGSATFEPAG
jgi:hypothetical protein